MKLMNQFIRPIDFGCSHILRRVQTEHLESFMASWTSRPLVELDLQASGQLEMTGRGTFRNMMAYRWV